MKQFQLLLLGILCFAACESNKVPAGATTFTLKAPYGTDYTIYVKLPSGYRDDQGKYPLVLYTDAEYLTQSTFKAVEASGLDEHAIVVGIGYAGENRRTQDYTPTATGYAGTGNAEAFLNFIEKDLLGYLVQHYAVSPEPTDRTYCGHSLGGLLGTYILFAKPALFGRYVLVSSSLMWDEQAIFRIEAQRRPQAQQAQARVFLGTGTVEENGFHATRQHLVKLLRQHYPGVTVKEVNYPNTDHAGVMQPALRDGIQYVTRL